MYTLKVKFNSLAELNKFVNGQGENTGNDAKSNDETSNKKPSGKKATEAKTENKEATKATTLPYETVKEKTMIVFKDKGRDVVSSILVKFNKNATTAKDLDPADYDAYVKELDKVIAEADPA